MAFFFFFFFLLNCGHWKQCCTSAAEGLFRKREVGESGRGALKLTARLLVPREITFIPDADQQVRTAGNPAPLPPLTPAPPPEKSVPGLRLRLCTPVCVRVRRRVEAKPSVRASAALGKRSLHTTRLSSSAFLHVTCQNKTLQNKEAGQHRLSSPPSLCFFFFFVNKIRILHITFVSSVSKDACTNSAYELFFHHHYNNRTAFKERVAIFNIE